MESQRACLLCAAILGACRQGLPSVGLSTLRVSEHASGLVAKRGRKKEARRAVGSAETWLVWSSSRSD
jgi:hypothetical protein